MNNINFSLTPATAVFLSSLISKVQVNASDDIAPQTIMAVREINEQLMKGVEAHQAETSKEIASAEPMKRTTPAKPPKVTKKNAGTA